MPEKDIFTVREGSKVVSKCSIVSYFKFTCLLSIYRSSVYLGGGARALQGYGMFLQCYERRRVQNLKEVYHLKESKNKFVLMTQRTKLHEVLFSLNLIYRSTTCRISRRIISRMKIKNINICRQTYAVQICPEFSFLTVGNNVDRCNFIGWYST